MSDYMTLDSAVLRDLAEILVRYCQLQNDTLDGFFTNMQSLGSEWQDDETFSVMMEEIRLLTNQSKQYFDELCTTYPALFRRMADQIDARPGFGQGSYSPGYSSGTSGSAGSAGSSGGGQTPVDPTIQSLYEKYARLSDQSKEKMLSGGPAKNINQFISQCWNEYRTNPNSGDFAKLVSLQMMQSYYNAGTDDEDPPPVLKLTKKR